MSDIAGRRRVPWPAMADHDDRSIEEQLEEIGAQLDWVRGYL
ncbi:MAG TPA: hypothetical protein VMT59_14855 [Gaiellaceae bacterium]|nr:hypothetical protein [Gaiellaceae bacterium]